MNEENSQRQLSRREIRERAARQAQHDTTENSAAASAEYSDTSTTGVVMQAEAEYTDEQLEIAAQLHAAVQVSPVNAAGEPLSRREYRAARSAEYQRLLAEWEAEHGPLAEYGVATADDEVAQSAPETVTAADNVAETADQHTPAPPLPRAAVQREQAPDAVTGQPQELAATQTPVAAAAVPTAAAAAEQGAAGAAGAAAEQSAAGAAEDAAAAVVSTAATSATVEFDAELPATQAFSVAELAEAAGAVSDDNDGGGENPTALQAHETGGAKKRRWPWSKKERESFADSDDVAVAARDAATHDAATHDETATNAAVAGAETVQSELAEAELVADPEPEVTVYTTENEVIVAAVEEAQVAAEAEIAPEAEPQAEPEVVAAAAKTEYSFPDIAPLDDDISVFDAGTQRQMSPETGFDTLINRAVAEENSATVTTGTAALILPTLPEEAVLAAALDEEKGVFVSGSIELPRSVGETGGHHSLHGNEAGEQEVLDEIFETNSHTQPVSALRAVSSQHAQVTQMLAETKKDNSKAPLIFAVSGGALVIAAGAVVIAAVNGMFG